MNETGVFVVDSSSMSGIMDTLTANLEVIVPYGIGITAVLIGVRFIPRLIKTFTRG